MGFSADRIEALKPAVAEACMNAIEPGNPADQATSVAVLLTAANKQLEIKAADEGLTPIPDVMPVPGRPGEPDAGSGGWGMFFISPLVDEMEITRLPEGGNQVRMVIYLTPADDKPKDNPTNPATPTLAQPDSPTK